MELATAQRRELFNLLVAAFPDAGALRRMVSMGLGAQVLTVMGNNNLQDQVFDLLQWAEAHDKVGDLITAAQAANPDHAALREFARARGLSVVEATENALPSSAGSPTGAPPAVTHGGVQFFGSTTIHGPVIGGNVDTLTFNAGSAAPPVSSPLNKPPSTAPAPTLRTTDPAVALYDVFVSYASADRQWVQDELVPALKNAGLRVCIDTDDFLIGLPIVNNIERAVTSSRYTLIVMTANWVASSWSDFEAQLTATQDPNGKLRRLIPIMLTACDPPLRITHLTYADFTDPVRRPTSLIRLVGQLQDLSRSAP